MFFGSLLVYFAAVTAVASYPIYRFRLPVEPLMVTVVTLAAALLALRVRAPSSRAPD